MESVTREQVIDYLNNLPVLELASLVHELEGKWGVSAQPVQLDMLDRTVAAYGCPPPGLDEQTEFYVNVIKVAADKKIAAIKVVREITGLGLKEAKELVESAEQKPATIKMGIGKAEAEELQKKLEDAGCMVKLV